MSEERIVYLLEKYIDDKASIEEREELTRIVDTPAYKGIVVENLEQLIGRNEDPAWTANRLDEMVQSVFAADRVMEGESVLAEKEEGVLVNGDFNRRRRWIRWVAAACIAGLLVAGYFLSREAGKSGSSKGEVVIASDVKAPHANRAMIKTADGKIIYLDSAANGSLINENGVSVVKVGDGQIVYSSELKAQGSELKYNTLSNPRGSKVIDMTLEDGSRVWLNAGSSITYPVAFIGSERKVAITGEAYFEVTHDENKKFIVDANGASTEVLGTHFNVNNYSDEASIKITLLEGSVKVSRNNSSELLKPGQQAVLRQAQDDNGIKVVNEVDVEEVMAWKNGLFKYNSISLQELMRQAARWYDVDISYSGPIANETYTGSIPRTVSLNTWFKVLEESGIHFRIDGKNVTVLSAK